MVYTKLKKKYDAQKADKRHFLELLGALDLLKIKFNERREFS
jgi:hypothetical protein